MTWVGGMGGGKLPEACPECPHGSDHKEGSQAEETWGRRYRVGCGRVIPCLGMIGPCQMSNTFGGLNI